MIQENIVILRRQETTMLMLCNCFPQWKSIPCSWATAGVSVPSPAHKANRCCGLIEKRWMSQSCICNAGIVLHWCHKVKHHWPVSSISAVSRKEICSLLTTCFNGNVLQYLKFSKLSSVFDSWQIYGSYSWWKMCDKDGNIQNKEINAVCLNMPKY